MNPHRCFTGLCSDLLCSRPMTARARRSTADGSPEQRRAVVSPAVSAECRNENHGSRATTAQAAPAEQAPHVALAAPCAGIVHSRRSRPHPGVSLPGHPSARRPCGRRGMGGEQRQVALQPLLSGLRQSRSDAAESRSPRSVPDRAHGPRDRPVPLTRRGEARPCARKCPVGLPSSIAAVRRISHHMQLGRDVTLNMRQRQAYAGGVALASRAIPRSAATPPIRRTRR